MHNDRFESLSREHIVNPIMRFSWAGWESDTLTLQRNGWQVSVEELPEENILRFALKHPQLNLYAISNVIRDVNSAYNLNGMVIRNLVVPLNMAGDIVFHVQERFNPLVRFQPIDCNPSIEEAIEERISIKHLCLFREVNAQDIEVPEPDVAELLREILGRQQPTQQQIRTRLLQADRKRKVHANIISMIA